jgi:hypothetical protein
MSLFLLKTHAALASPYLNMREGNSRFIAESIKPHLQEILENEQTKQTLGEIINNNQINSCASKIVFEINDQLKLESSEELENILKALRFNNQIDDIVLDLLLKAVPLSNYQPSPFALASLSDDEENLALNIIKQHVVDIKNKANCIEDSFRDLAFDLASKNPKFIKHLKQLFKSAYKNNIISKDTYRTLDNLKQNKVHLWPLSLSEYKKSLSTLAKKFPNRKEEESDFVTVAMKKEGISLREQLYEKYNYQQIILLSNIISNLKKRLDASDISIDILYENQSKEIISLTPMEKFRFILKQLRRELSSLNNGSLLNGKAASYTDLIVASYEVGSISSDEISKLASLQEIWNPSKTTKEKVFYWVKTFGGTATVLLPPPYGFISVMALMFIDQQISTNTINHDLDYLLF